MREPETDQPIGIQRIALELREGKVCKVDRFALGRTGVVKLWPAGLQLVVGEGLETTLAAATRIPYRGAPLQPAWSAVSSGGKPSPGPRRSERLIVLVDHDAMARARPQRRCVASAGPARDAPPFGSPETGRCRFQRPGHAGARVMSTENDDNDPFTEDVSDRVRKDAASRSMTSSRSCPRTSHFHAMPGGVDLASVNPSCRGCRVTQGRQAKA
jgi:hypothetical protein